MRTSIALATLLMSSVAAVEFRFTNKCSYTINLRGANNLFVCDLAPGQTRGNNCGKSIQRGDIGIFKHGNSDEANLLEYSYQARMWYDMSNIPPGPRNCKSYQDCKAFTGKTGYNVPVTVTPTKYNNGASCRTLVDTADNAPDAYLFPDDIKTHDCPADEVFDVIYCPNGSGQTSSQPTGAATCKTFASTDFYGSDIGNSPVSGSLDQQVGLCCRKCTDTANCAAYTVAYNTCYLKSSVGTLTSGKSGVTSGLRSGYNAAILNNHDFWGNDIGRYNVSGSQSDRAAMCAATCAANTKCAAWTVNGDWCYIKSQASNAQYSSTAFSGKK
ncbi:hypothetical protein ACHHYP_13530 [Achlya hypogyna]|uniref:Secreted protein n=1 Tax=Achlya hypogyna TaxID=1202772 RepID=A0A0A7CP71_ACHHY|nr:secreted protein [Achlya hypogyna]OQR84312.1 hypothetical protein ACHHYP_13530 [Achlya hypogyna]